MKIYNDPEVGEVQFVKSCRSRRITVRVHPVRGVSVSIPAFVSYEQGMKFYISKRDWVLKTMARQKEKQSGSAPVTAEKIRELTDAAVKVLPGRLAYFAEKYGLKYNRLALKNNVSNWGSCSVRNNINLNVRLMMLPSHLQDYVILHELCHLKHHDHSERFHTMLESLCSNEFGANYYAKGSRFPVSRALEKEIRRYSPSFLPSA